MKKPYFIPEPYGLPFELTEKDKFRLKNKTKYELWDTEGKVMETFDKGVADRWMLKSHLTCGGYKSRWVRKKLMKVI